MASKVFILEAGHIERSGVKSEERRRGREEGRGERERGGEGGGGRRGEGGSLGFLKPPPTFRRLGNGIS